jgi:putative ABC transport system permease protein
MEPMPRFISLILKNTWRNRRRTVLTVFSIAVSLCLLGVLVAMYAAMYYSKPSAAQQLRLVTRNRVSLTLPLPIYYKQKIRSLAGVREVGMSQWFGGVYKDSRDPNNFFARLAAEPENLFILHGEWQVPEDQKKAFRQDQTACIIGRRLAGRLNLRLGDRVTLVGDIFPVTLELTVKAIYDAPENTDALFFNWKYLEEAIPAGRRSVVGTFNILAASAEDVPRITRAVDETFRNSPFETKTETEQQFGLSFLSFLGNVKLFLLSICGAVTFTILLVSANTMAMSVRERIREVGILKTIGFTTGGVLTTILGEAVLISLAGGVLGLVLASMLCAVMRRGPFGFGVLQNLGLQPGTAALCLALAVFIGVLSSLVPALAAARTGIVAAVRDEG